MVNWSAKKIKNRINKTSHIVEVLRASENITRTSSMYEHAMYIHGNTRLRQPTLYAHLIWDFSIIFIIFEKKKNRLPLKKLRFAFYSNSIKGIVNNQYNGWKKNENEVWRAKRFPIEWLSRLFPSTFDRKNTCIYVYIYIGIRRPGPRDFSFGVVCLWPFSAIVFETK